MRSSPRSRSFKTDWKEYLLVGLIVIPYGLWYAIRLLWSFTCSVICSLYRHSMDYLKYIFHISPVPRITRPFSQEVIISHTSECPAADLQQQSDFLSKWPLELRQAVYDQILNTNIRVHTVVRPYMQRSLHATPDQTNGLALALVCKQMHSETVQRLYENTVFELDGFTLLYPFLECLPPHHHGWIKEIRLKVSLSSSPLETSYAYMCWQDQWSFCSRELEGIRSLHVIFQGFDPRPWPSRWLEPLMKMSMPTTIEVRILHNRGYYTGWFMESCTISAEEMKQQAIAQAELQSHGRAKGERAIIKRAASLAQAEANLLNVKKFSSR